MEEDGSNNENQSSSLLTSVMSGFFLLSQILALHIQQFSLGEESYSFKDASPWKDNDEDEQNPAFWQMC